MSALPTPPIVTDDRGDIQFHATVSDACLDLEALDVRTGVYDAFDARGHRVRLEAHGETVSMEIDPASPPERDELLLRLRRYLSRVGAARVGVVDPDEAPLEELLSALAAFQLGGSKARRWSRRSSRPTSSAPSA